MYQEYELPRTREDELPQLFLQRAVKHMTEYKQAQAGVRELQPALDEHLKELFENRLTGIEESITRTESSIAQLEAENGDEDEPAETGDGWRIDGYIPGDSITIRAGDPSQGKPRSVTVATAISVSLNPDGAPTIHYDGNMATDMEHASITDLNELRRIHAALGRTLYP